MTNGSPHMAQAFKWPERILVHPVAKTDAGFSIWIGPWWTLRGDASPASIGEAVRKALSDAPASVPQPNWQSSEWKSLTKARHMAAGVKSERGFVVGSKLVAIEHVNHAIRITPTRNGGTSGPDKGFHELLSARIGVREDADSATLGSRIMEGWARST